MKHSENKIVAILGPTNTGKTYMAIEKMLEFNSGIFGLPLRLLAREVYDKCVLKLGTEKVALITGEEKIIPSDAKYYICTVESMPKDKIVDFVAVDEIQMCGDTERGHIFTDRLLNFRGEALTMFLGSQIMKNIISQLLKNVEFINQERFSKLSYNGSKKISRLNRKSAIIAFSIEEVYALAELVRRQKGGSAVIMGSLSPKTRNSQVELYQSGDVDYLVATDAIGMGINMDIEQINFSSLRKFDGKKRRRLRMTEISQIAGRAGRFKNDGYFGITGDCENLEADEIERIEKHNLDDNNCPTDLIVDETVSIDSNGDGFTEYRVAEVLRVYREVTNSLLLASTNYVATSNGIDCLTCTPGQVLDVTYRRLWLDEEDDASSSHFLAAPGVATEPFMGIVGTPCTALARSGLEKISGTIDPSNSETVTGVGTAFLLELSAGDGLKVGQEVRTVTSITSDTLLTVDFGLLTSLIQFSKIGFETSHMFVSGFSFLATPSTTTIVFCSNSNCGWVLILNFSVISNN